MCLDLIKSYLDVLQSVLTIIGIFIGAYWVLRNLYKRREEAVKIRLKHDVYSKPIDRGHHFLRVSLIIENLGNVRIKLNKINTYLFKVKPWPPDILNYEKMHAEGYGYYNWPAVSEDSNRIIMPDKVVIEPNELDEFHFDFVFESSVKAIFIYSYVENPTRKRWFFWKIIGIGWNLSTTYDIEKEKKNG